MMSWYLLPLDPVDRSAVYLERHLPTVLWTLQANGEITWTGGRDFQNEFPMTCPSSVFNRARFSLRAQFCKWKGQNWQPRAVEAWWKSSRVFKMYLTSTTIFDGWKSFFAHFHQRLSARCELPGFGRLTASSASGSQLDGILS